MPAWLNDISLGLSAIIVAGITAVGTWGAAYLNLKAKGVTPQEASRLTERIGFRNEVNESMKLAMDIAADAKAEAQEALDRVQEVLLQNAKLLERNTMLEHEVNLLRARAERVPILEGKINRMKVQMNKHKAQVKNLKAQLARRK